jgi:8-oxo-dGTP pyrophosphatase MutT (NUDIX family)
MYNRTGASAMNLSAEETVQIVDTNNLPIDAQPRAVMRRQGLIHRASYILVFNSGNQLFIQKRTPTKDIYPGYWDIAAGGVVLAGESYDTSARRELAEELGVTDTPLEYLFDHYYQDENNKVWGAVYRCCHNGPFILQKEEVEYGVFISVSEILENRDHRLYTPDGIEILKRLQQPIISD